MMEIERKFLVEGNFRSFILQSIAIKQAYLCKDEQHTIRIRIAEPKAWITIKGKPEADEISRFEWEKPLDMDEATILFERCTLGKIEKIRHLIPQGGHTFEVDEFLGNLKGLIIAEIELKHPAEIFERPEWLGNEVSEDIRYTNAALAESQQIPQTHKEKN
ncbi:MAG: CYTH domain-containing protein [Bacteroidetes bacterium]|nr:CYTH domain-containing protein [Bacteroidota bacterium]MBU1579418.1 CYTH domain-containing protein [Bacteroidota bacterium]MBU2466547.1 CYTH domain-containing protein [Bacteroidota bacterium]MBU2556630.1 CYTH domain-containing protein [Bacteroidota bacterium]